MWSIAGTNIAANIVSPANDFANLGGGYVVIGQDCDESGQPIFPPAGLAANQLDKIQQQLLAACQFIQPPYFPVLSIELVEGRNLLVLWAPGGMNRPYKSPASVTAKAKNWHYYIRRYSSTVEAKGETEQELRPVRPRLVASQGRGLGGAWVGDFGLRGRRRERRHHLLDHQAFDQHRELRIARGSVARSEQEREPVIERTAIVHGGAQPDGC